MKLWDLNTGQELSTLTARKHEIFKSVAVAADGRTAVSGASNGSLQVWDLAEGRELRRLVGDSASVNDVAITPDGRYVASVFSDGVLEVWETQSGAKVRMLNAHAGQALAVSVTRTDGAQLSGT